MAVDPAFAKFQNKDPPDSCLEIWRVEDFQLKAVPKSDYGTFYDGDAYIVLHIASSKMKGSKAVHVFFWLGNNCSQDESGAAAVKALELDDLFNGIAVQHREVQGNESNEFIGIFRKLIYRAGGVKSGFTHVEIVDRKELYQIKGRSHIRILNVPVNFTSLNKGDCFILCVGQRLFTLLGSKCSGKEKHKAMSFAEEDLKTYIRNLYDCKDIKHDVLDEEKISRANNAKDLDEEYQKFLKELGVVGVIPPINEGMDDGAAQKEIENQCRLYRVSDESGTVRMTEVEKSPLSQSLLDTNDTFILEMPGLVCVWKGKNANMKERKEALKRAEGFVEAKNLPSHTMISTVSEGNETAIFKSAFYNWQEKYIPMDKTYNIGRGIAKVEKKRFDFATLQQRSLNEEKQRPKLFDDGSGTYVVWRVEFNSDSRKLERKQLPEQDYGIFYSGDCYIVQYKYIERNRERCVIYFWLGDHSGKDEQGGAALHARELDDEMGGSAIQVRLVEGKETEHFLLLFKGQFIVKQGGLASGFQKDDGTPEDKHLFRIRGNTVWNTKAIEVDARARSLNSNDCFFLHSSSFAFVWYGKNANGDERDLALKVAERIVKRPTENYLEGSERADFWQALGGKEEYATEPDLKGEMTSHEPRLFEVSNASGNLTWTEIFGFDQDDMDEDDVMILDTYDFIYVWLGNGSRKDEREGAWKNVLEYLSTDLTGRKLENTIVMRIKQGNEPIEFTYHFESWDPELFKIKKDQADALRSSINATNCKISAAELEKSMRQKKVKQTYPYEVLSQLEVPDDVDPTCKEQWLSDDEFIKVFSMTKEKFGGQPKWRQDKAKKDKQLF